MSDSEKMLEARLSALPDLYPDFVRLSMLSIKGRGLVDEVLEMLDETEGATTETVLAFEDVYCGDIEVYDENGLRAPVDVGRLALTFGMRDILRGMKGRMFKSYEYASLGGDEHVADCNMRLNMGQYALDLNCYSFAFAIAETTAELGAMHCERMSLLDDFRPWSDAPVRAYAVGERITGVELVTDHVEVGAGGEAQELDIDVAVALRTAHAVYTFARESWRSTGIRVSAADGAVVPYAEGDCDGSWIFGPGMEGASVKAARSTTRLA